MDSGARRLERELVGGASPELLVHKGASLGARAPRGHPLVSHRTCRGLPLRPPVTARVLATLSPPPGPQCWDSSVCTHCASQRRGQCPPLRLIRKNRVRSRQHFPGEIEKKVKMEEKEHRDLSRPSDPATSDPAWRSDLPKALPDPQPCTHMH